MSKNPTFRTLGLIISVTVSFFLLWFGAYQLMHTNFPFTIETDAIISGIIILGFFVGAGFAFKKLKIF